ncbi:MAG: ACT domain-containing protein, partial [bacterium]|nr:ACT domain-containing protein [Candidatus Kapabacteria bacterium]
RRNVRLVTSGEGAHPSYTSMISADVATATASRSAAATVFGLNEVRIVEIDGVVLDVKPEGTLLMFGNLDKPGVLAAVSGVLARNAINIANVSLGRREGEGKATTVIRVDEQVSDSVIGELKSLDVIEDIRLLRF